MLSRLPAIVAGVMAAALAVQVSGCAALVVSGTGQSGTYGSDGQAAGGGERDRRLSEQVSRRFRGDGELQGADIEVTARDGVVTLRGAVKDFAARAQAEVLAAGVPGVHGVHNELKVAAVY